MRSRAGYTLVELMVVMALSLVVSASVYVIYDRSVSAYRVEGQVLDLQDRLRFGLEHLKRDMRRAGFLASPNSVSDENVCPKPDFDLRALVLQPNSGTVYEPWAGANPYVQPSSVVMFGDFFSGQVYKTAGVSDNKVFLQGTDNFPVSQVEFERIFNENRYLRVVTRDQFEILLPIQSADFMERSVTLTRTMPRVDSGTQCGIVGFGEGLDTNVAGFVRYRIAADTRPGAPTGKTDLIREELDPDGVTVVPGSQLVIADYAVDLQFYDFGFDIDSTGSSPNIALYSLITSVADQAGGGLLGSLAGSQPENLRFVTVKLTVRTANEDEDHAMVQRENPYSPLVSFEVSQMTGACRTLSLASRVELTSLAVRNLKGTTP